MVLLRTAKMTDTGLVRPNNEDCIGEFQFSYGPVKVNCLAVADGIGGHQAGDIASKLTIEYLQDYLHNLEDNRDLSQVLMDVFSKINQLVFREATRRPDYEGMGTTLTSALIEGKNLWIGHVGDSRAYLYREPSLQCLTEDHSVVGEMVRNGQLTREEARLHPWHNIIQQAIGLDPTVDVAIYKADLLAGDILLLCTDGLTDLLSEEELKTVISKSKVPDLILNELHSIAIERGAYDNYSIIIAYQEESELND